MIGSDYHHVNLEYGSAPELLCAADWQGWSQLGLGAPGMFLNYCYYIPREGWVSVGAR